MTKSFSSAVGQARGQWLPGISVKQPEHEKTEGQIQFKNAWYGVAESIVVSKWKEVLEIGSKGANNDGRHDETCSPERQSCSSMGERKWHYKNYDGSARVRSGCGQIRSILLERILQQIAKQCLSSLPKWRDLQLPFNALTE